MKLFNQSFSKYFAKGEGIRAFFFFYWRKLFSSFSQGFLLVLMEIDLATVTLAAPLLWLPDSAP